MRRLDTIHALLARASINAIAPNYKYRNSFSEPNGSVRDFFDGAVNAQGFNSRGLFRIKRDGRPYVEYRSGKLGTLFAHSSRAEIWKRSCEL